MRQVSRLCGPDSPLGVAGGVSSCPADPLEFSVQGGCRTLLPSFLVKERLSRVDVCLTEATLTSEADGALETQPSPYSLLFHPGKVITPL